MPDPLPDPFPEPSVPPPITPEPVPTDVCVTPAKPVCKFVPDFRLSLMPPRGTFAPKLFRIATLYLLLSWLPSGALPSPRPDTSAIAPFGLTGPRMSSKGLADLVSKAESGISSTAC